MPVLLVKGYQCTGSVDAGLPPGVVQQRERRQRVRVALVGHQRTDLAREAHAFVAELVADRRRAGRRPVAFGEDGIDAGEYVRCALGQQPGRWHPQRYVGMTNLVLGPGYSLSDRR